MATRIQLRKGLSTEWTNKNPILLAGEAGVETDTHKMKVGDGTQTWTQLPYTGSDGGSGSGPYFLSGTSAPSDGVGTDGDFYLCTTTQVLYGPKAGSWPMIGSLSDDTIGGPGGVCDVAWLLPEADGESGQFMVTSGEGYLSWADSPYFLLFDENTSYTGYTYSLAGYMTDVILKVGKPYTIIVGTSMIPNFVGWNTRADGTGLWYHTGDSIVISAGMLSHTVVLYAQVSEQQESYSESVVVPITISGMWACVLLEDGQALGLIQGTTYPSVEGHYPNELSLITKLEYDSQLFVGNGGWVLADGTGSRRNYVSGYDTATFTTWV